MGYSIRVAAQVPRERASEFFLEKNFDSLEAFDEAKKLCDNKKRIGFFESLVIPVRTDNLTNFSKDFFRSEKNFDSLEAFDEAKKLCDNKKRIGFFESLVIPVRTDNLTNFSKDFF